jgi:hypothetical protein
LKKFYLFCFIFTSCLSIFGQTERPVSDFKSFIKILQEESVYTFSYPAELEELKFLSTIIKKNITQEELNIFFNRINLETKIYGNHILIREKIPPPEKGQILSLKVIDSKSNEPLDWAAVTIYGPEERVYFTNEKGEVNLPKNLEKMVVSQLGYESKTIFKNEIREVIKLDVKPVMPGTALKRGTQPAFKSTSKSQIQTINYTQPYASEVISVAGIRDVLATVQMLPGINATDERSGSLKIRGSNSDATNIFLNGIPVIQSGHYFDLFSSINPLYVSNIQVYKNFTPLQDLSNTGGAVYLQSRSLDKKNPVISADINFLTAAVNGFIPLSPHLAITAALRTNLSDISNNSFYSLNRFNPPRQVENMPGSRLSEILLRSSPSFGFYDGNLNMEYRYKYGKLVFSYHKIHDDFENTITQNQRISFRPNQPQLIIGVTDNLRNWDSDGFGITKSFRFNKTWSTKLKYYQTGYDERYNLASKLNLTPSLNNISNQTAFNTSLKVNDISWSGDYTSADNFVITAGLSATKIENQGIYSSSRIKGFNQTGENNLLSIFSKIAHQSDQNTFEAGLKINRVHQSTLPDFSVQYDRMLTQSSSLKFSFSQANQWMRKVNVRDVFDQSLSFWTQYGPEMPVLRSRQIMAGIKTSVSGLYFDFEAYVKNMDGVTEFINQTPQLKEPLQNLQELRLVTGTGSVKGIDILGRYESGYFDGQVAYTLSRSVNKIEEIFAGNPYPSINDRTHQFKMINTLKFKNWAFSINNNYASGVPFFTGRIDNDKKIKDQNKVEIIRRLPDYLRHDLGVTYGLKKNKFSAKIKADIVNFTNRQNINNIQYLSSVRDPKDPNAIVITGTSVNMINRTFNLGLFLEF